MYPTMYANVTRLLHHQLPLASPSNLTRFLCTSSTPLHTSSLFLYYSNYHLHTIRAGLTAFHPSLSHGALQHTTRFELSTDRDNNTSNLNEHDLH